MAAVLQLRRGVIGDKPSLAAGEFYVSTTNDELYLGTDGAGGELLLAKLNSTNIGDFLISGDLTIGGDIVAPIITAFNNKFAAIGAASASWEGGGTDISALNAFTSSQNTKNTTLETVTSSLDTRLDDEEAATTIFETKFTTIGTQSGSWGSGADITALNAFTASQNTKNTTLENTTGSIIIFTGSALLRLSSLETATSSFETKFATIGTQSGSWGSGVVPAGTISGSAQITAFGFVSGSYETTGRGIISGSSQITPLLPTGVVSGSTQVKTLLPTGTVSGSSQVLGGSGVYSSSAQISGFETTGRGIVSSSTQIVPLLPTGVVSGSSQVFGGSGVWSGSGQLPTGVLSGSAQITAFGFVSGSYETTGRGIVSSSAQIVGLGFTTTASFNAHTTSIHNWSQSVEDRFFVISAASGSWGPGSSGLSGVTDSATIDFTNNSGVITAVAIGGIISGAQQITDLGFGTGGGVTSSYLELNGSTFYTSGSSIENFNDTASIFLGYTTAVDAVGAYQSVFIGSGSGHSATDAYNSIFIGKDAGKGASSGWHSVFLGQGAGQSATTANYSNFIGSSAGIGATTADESNFMGYAAGGYATGATNSNFLGRFAGYQAANASYSTLIGWQAGRNNGSNNIGTNNIIIGTNITLENNRRDSINLGGIIFATGSSITYGATPYSGSVGNGKVGINVVLPEAALHVSGSGIYTGTLTASLAEGYTWVGGAGNISTLVATSSFGGGGGSTDISALNAFTASQNTKNTTLENVTASIHTFTASVLPRLTSIESATASFEAKFATIGTQSGSWGGSSTDITLLNQYTQSQDTKNTTLENVTASLQSFTASANSRLNNLELDSASQDGRLDNLESTSASVNNSVSLLNSYTQSNDTKWTNLTAQSGSWVTEAESGSFLITASISNTTLTFKKGDNSTFDINLPTAGGGDSVLQFVGDGSNGGTFYTSGSSITDYNANASSTGFLAGVRAGRQTSNAPAVIAIGYQAGRNATNAGYSIFMNNSAGDGATNAYGSIFMGPLAGWTAAYASSSNFLGQQAGDRAYSASYSNFLGNTAGHKAQNAAYSNLFGYRAGRAESEGNSIGSNNIIIGTNISLEPARQDSINLGGIIFATGSYNTPTGNVFSGSVGNGKVGINVVNPEAALHVSGSTIVRGNFTASLQENYIWIGNATGTSSAQLIYDYIGWGSISGVPQGLLSGSDGFVSSSSQLTASYDTRYELQGRGIISSSVQLGGIYETTGRGIVSSSTQVIELLPSGVVSGSLQILGGSGVWSSSTQMPAGVISSSAQLDMFETTGRGIISGAAQLENATITNLTITNLKTINETASVIYSSGSNQLGDQLSDTQILSGSVQIVGGLTVNGVQVSTQSFVDLTPLNQFTSSANISITSLNNATSSYETTGRGIVSSSTQITSFGFLTTSSFNSYTASISTASLVDRLNAIESVSGAWITESETGSFLTSLNGAISSSAQLTELNTFTGSANSRLNNLELFTSSVPALTSLNSFTQSILGTNSWTASVDTKWNTLGTQSGSWITEAETGSFLITASVVDDDITFTKGDGSSFTIQINTGSFAETASLASNIVVNVKNTTGGQINKGTIVRIINATGDNALIQTASWANDANSANTLGWVYENIPNDGFGRVITQGTLLGINTQGMTAGQMLYLSSSGQYTNIVPQAPYHEVRVGQVLRQQSNNGSVFVSIMNGYELTELHDVDINTGTLLNNNLVAWNSASQQWVNKTVTGVGALTTSSFNSYTSSADGRFTSIESATASFEAKFATIGTQSGSWGGGGSVPAGTVSGSSQLTSSYDTRYELQGSGIVSGSAQVTPLLPTNTVSSSAQITAFGFISSSTNTGLVVPVLDPLPSTPESGSTAISASNLVPGSPAFWIYFGGTWGPNGDGWFEAFNAS